MVQSTGLRVNRVVPFVTGASIPLILWSIPLPAIRFPP